MFLPPLFHPLFLLTTLTTTTTTTTTTTHHSPPSRRKTTSLDPYIICLFPPLYHSYPLISLPPLYSRAEYPTLTDLCSALNGARRNLGCTCHTAFGQVDCDQSVADPVLWSWLILPGEEETFADHCRRDCYCTSTTHAADARDADARRRTLSGMPMPEETGVGALYHFGPYHGHGGGGEVEGGGEGYGGDDDSSSAEDQSGGHDDDDGRGSTPSHNGVAGAGAGGVQWENSCGRNCTMKKDCAATAGRGGQGAQRQDCACVAAQSSQYQPGNGVVAFVAACIVSLAAGSGNYGGKRAVKEEGGVEDSPCPCNRTYVSYACCGADDGVVWEREEFRLGELVGGWKGLDWTG